MKLVVFGPDARLGVLQGDRILDLTRAAAAGGFSESVRMEGGQSFFASLLQLIESGDRGLDLVRSLSEKFGGSDQPGLHVGLAAVSLKAPFPGRRFALAGSNYAAHVADAYTNMGKPISAAEVYAKARRGKAGGFWAVDPPVGPGAAIPFPSGCKGLFDYEAEVAVVLGRGGKRIKAEQWPERVWGTTLVIDWSVRSQDLLASQQPFYAHKVFDSSKCMGPWIAVDEADPACCDVVTRVNGQVRQRFNSRDMVHSFGELLEQMSEDLTLQPGDVLSGGTGPGTAADKTVPGPDGRLPLELFLKPGDTVEVTSPQIGSLQARIVPSA